MQGSIWPKVTLRRLDDIVRDINGSIEHKTMAREYFKW